MGNDTATFGTTLWDDYVPLTLIDMLLFHAMLYHCFYQCIIFLLLWSPTYFARNRFSVSWHIVLSLLLTNWGRVTHICVNKLIIIGSDNGLSPGRRQAIIWTNAGILSIGTLGTNFSEILIEVLACSFKKMRLKSRPRNGVHFLSTSMS